MRGEKVAILALQKGRPESLVRMSKGDGFGASLMIVVSSFRLVFNKREEEEDHLAHFDVYETFELPSLRMTGMQHKSMTTGSLSKT